MKNLLKSHPLLVLPFSIVALPIVALVTAVFDFLYPEQYSAADCSYCATHREYWARNPDMPRA